MPGRNRAVTSATRECSRNNRYNAVVFFKATVSIKNITGVIKMASVLIYKYGVTARDYVYRAHTLSFPILPYNYKADSILFPARLYFSK
jgi:hypothetical protein